MKNIFIIALAFTLFLASCSIDWNDSTEQKITDLEKQITELKTSTSTGMMLFEKRTRCGALTSDIEKRIDSLGKKYTDLGVFSIGGIFYSPVKDACLWIRVTDTYAKDGSPMQRQALYQYGDDFGATEPLIGCEKILGEKQGVNTCEKWESELQKLKGEDERGVFIP
ncbi:MAG: hypothetical protein PHN60_01420 [Candidatus Gracilibacteria bacterium]|nr:hypothetical protein [Candidatus Gracilibacteria bacterium]